MHIVLVNIHLKNGYIKEFIDVSLENARNSIHEPGILRFDFLHNVEDPSQFTLYEVYRSLDDQLKHRMTDHYLSWKASVEEMMAEPRQGIKYINIFPDDLGWV